MSTMPTMPTMSNPSEHADLSKFTGRSARSKRSVSPQKWSRIVHVYTSMFSLLIVLFFAITGVTLNHPNWTFGTKGNRVDTTGSLPQG